MTLLGEHERPAWLEPGARVLVRAYGRGQPPKVRTVLSVEFPWLVFFEGYPGATHARNVLELAP